MTNIRKRHAIGEQPGESAESAEQASQNRKPRQELNPLTHERANCSGSGHPH